MHGQQNIKICEAKRRERERERERGGFILSTNFKLCSFFWVTPRRLNFICRRFGTLCSIFAGDEDGITQTKECNIQNAAKV